jgi:hypothetical protein
VTVEVDREPARDAAQRELTDPRYEHRSWWDDFADWLGRHLLDRVSPAHPRDSFWDGSVMPLLVLLLVLVLGALVVFFARRATRSPAKKKAIFADEAAELSSAGEHRERSLRAASAGDWATATAERVRAVVKELDERAVLALTPGRTADEFAFLASGLLPELEEGFTAAARAFDEVVYGERPGSERAYQDAARLDEAIPGSVRSLARTDQKESVVGGDSGPAAEPSARGLARAGREAPSW